MADIPKLVYAPGSLQLDASLHPHRLTGELAVEATIKSYSIVRTDLGWSPSRGVQA